MSIKLRQMCRGSIMESLQPHFERLLPVNTNVPTEYSRVWNCGRVNNLIPASNTFTVTFKFQSGYTGYQLLIFQNATSHSGSPTVLGNRTGEDITFEFVKGVDYYIEVSYTTFSESEYGQPTSITIVDRHQNSSSYSSGTFYPETPDRSIPPRETVALGDNYTIVCLGFRKGSRASMRVYNDETNVADNVKAYLIEIENSYYELHFFGYGATANFMFFDSVPYYTAPWASFSTRIKSIYVEDGITDIGQYTFCGYVGSDNPESYHKIHVFLSETVRTLQNFAFYKAPVNGFFSGGNGLRRLHEQCLYAASNSQNIRLPSSIRVVDSKAIAGYDSETGWLETQTNGRLNFAINGKALAWGHASDDRIIIAEGVEGICCYHWANYENVTNIYLPTTTKYIASYAFAEYYSVRRLKLPQGTKHIYHRAFSEMESLRQLWIPSSVTKISTTDIDEYGRYGVRSYVFDGCSTSLIVYCEAQSKPDGWSEYFDNIDFSNKVQVVWGVSESEFDNIPLA